MMTYSLVGEKTIALSIAQEILSTSVQIPAIPENIQQIFKMVRQPEDKIDIPEFAHLVESDPGLFTRILQLANSSYYKEIEQIVSLRMAITRIGLKESVDAVCLGFFQKLLPKFPDIEGFSYNEYWSFSWACAAAARRLGHPGLGMDVLAGDLYLSGMLQGLGKLLLAIHAPEQFAYCVSEARKGECPLYEVEREVFGTTDGLVASRVLTTWQMPENICQSVGFCQMPDQAQPEYMVIAGLVQFAYAMAGTSGIGTCGDGKILALSETFLGQKSALELGKPKVQDALVAEVTSDLQKKSGSIFPNSPTPRTKASIRKKNPAPSRPKKKKGLIGWVKSLMD